MNCIRRFLKEQGGQSLVVFALSITVLFGAAAFGIDLGQAYLVKNRLQRAADAAAEGAALCLSDMDAGAAANAEEYAIEIAARNGAPRDGVAVVTPYEGDPMLVEVTCTKLVNYGFARVLGYESGLVSCRAVAKKVNHWVGEALPFLNMTGEYWNDTYYDKEDGDQKNTEKNGALLTIWDKTNNGEKFPGNFDRIADKQDGASKDYWKQNKGKHQQDYTAIDYSNGVTIVNGKRAYVKGLVEDLYRSGETVYLFSLKQSVIEAGKYQRAKNNTDVPLADLVLLQVKIVSYNDRNKDHNMTVKVLNIYDIGNEEFPTTFLRGGATTGLIE